MKIYNKKTGSPLSAKDAQSYRDNEKLSFNKVKLLASIEYLYNLAYESGITNGDDEATGQMDESRKLLTDFIKINYKQ